MSAPLLVATEDRVRTITLNRPEARNALTVAMRQELMERVSEAGGDDAVDVIVITGTDPAFCAGVDLKELRAREPGAPRPASNPGDALRTVVKPLVCAVNGACVTGGLEIALSCHFIVASERATFADRHAQFGLVPGWGLSALLPAAVGIRRAREMSITGGFVDAAEALRLGLVNHVVPHRQLMPFTRKLGAAIVSGNARANRAILELYAMSDGAPLAERLANESELVAGWRVDEGALARDPSVRKRKPS
jgi:enoyl-CoA hydratase